MLKASDIETMNACPLCGGGQIRTLDAACHICK
jgi:hypothetical protein